MTYIVRTVDEDWIDLLYPPSRIDDKRGAWREAQRRVRDCADCKTLVIDRRTGAVLWQSEPEILPRYEVVTVDRGLFQTAQGEASRTAKVLSTHRERDAALTAFQDTLGQTSSEIVILRDITAPHVIHRTSDDLGDNPGGY